MKRRFSVFFFLGALLSGCAITAHPPTIVSATNHPDAIQQSAGVIVWAKGAEGPNVKIYESRSANVRRDWWGVYIESYQRAGSSAGTPSPYPVYYQFPVPATPYYGYPYP